MVGRAVAAEGLSLSFGDVPAVQDLTVSVASGEVYGFLGLNGAGKTTTVRMLTGALPPDAGRALIHDVDVHQEPHLAAPSVGVVFGENIATEPHWSPVRYLRHFGRLYGLSRDEEDERVRALFAALRLEADAERTIGTLSSGNRRKVELARALLHRPKVLFLDEPTRELDIPAKRSVWEFLGRLVREDGVTVFLSSHDVHEIATLCTRIGIIAGGRLTWDGTPDDLSGEEAGLADALVDRLEGRGTRRHEGH